jgi:hyperosmotically inducible protein
MSQRWQHEVRAIVACFAFGALAACATHAQKSAGEAIDDTVLVSTVKSRLIGTKGVSANDINLEAYKGRVQLAGFVASEQERATAIDVAKSVAGVASISDALVVFTEGRTAGEVFDDGVLASKVKTAVTQTEGFGKMLDVNIEVRKGNVLLSGFVPSEDAKAKAGDAVRAVPNVKTVYNNIDIGQ